jgi:hypothetical protein
LLRSGAASARDVERAAEAAVSLLAEDAGLLVESSTAPTRQVLAVLLSTGAARCAAAAEDVGTDVGRADFPIVDGEAGASLLVDEAVVWVESMTGPTRNMACVSSRFLRIVCTCAGFETICEICIATEWDFRASSGHEIAAGPTLHICAAATCPRAPFWLKISRAGSEMFFSSESSRSLAISGMFKFSTISSFTVVASICADPKSAPGGDFASSFNPIRGFMHCVAALDL